MASLPATDLPQGADRIASIYQFRSCHIARLIQQRAHAPASCCDNWQLRRMRRPLSLARRHVPEHIERDFRPGQALGEGFTWMEMKLPNSFSGS